MIWYGMVWYGMVWYEIMITERLISSSNSKNILFKTLLTLASAGVIIWLYMSLFCTSSNATWNCGSFSSWFRRTMLSGRNLQSVAKAKPKAVPTERTTHLHVKRPDARRETGGISVQDDNHN